MTRFLLVRHAQSTWNAAGRWQGQADPPLTDLGRRQARLAAAAIGQVGDVVASDLLRARETAEIIAATIGCGPVRAEPRLRERTAGPWEGLTRREIDVLWPRYLHEGRRPPGYERDPGLISRITDALVDLADDAIGPVLVVTHGGVVNALERNDSRSWVRLPNLGGLWVDVAHGTIELGERVALLDEHPAATTTPAQL